jgi:hypothetical protein
MHKLAESIPGLLKSLKIRAPVGCKIYKTEDVKILVVLNVVYKVIFEYTLFAYPQGKNYETQEI